ncbi:MAG: MFS transporter [Rudaea sp.]|uniref:MFS transporter n=1 Tax=unclassified Rudaea TaxID=2627037 RepID=UPI0010F607FF|nr:MULTISPECIES: MFS transporter [unclassified Rudaea]MBN8884315.1 MFS transporter [Rudaea sp.]MBR0347176.1 MFS transporter [Rudaea sp.]
MLRRYLAARLNGRLHYAYVVAALTFVTLLVVAGIRATPAVLIVPLEKNFGWSRDQITLAVSIGLALFGLMGPFAAAAMQRFGIRGTMVAALLLLASAMGGSAFVTSPLGLILTWGVLAGIGTGTMAMVLGVTVVNRWFEHNRGSVLGLLTASTATGSLIFLPLLTWFIDHGYDWRVVVYIVAGAAVVLIALVLLLMPERPAEVGLHRYGATGADANDASRANPLTAAFGALATASRSGTFWLLFATFFVCGLSTNGLIGTHMIAFCADNGIPETRAAGLLMVMGIFDIIGTTASGWLSDRYDSRLLLCAYYGLRGLSLLYLPYSDFSIGSLGLFTVFYGLDWIATVPPTVRLTTDRFGPQLSPLVYGWIGAGHQLGAATAAYGAGVIRVQTNQYVGAFFVAGAACIVAAILVMLIRRRAAQLQPLPA